MNEEYMNAPDQGEDFDLYQEESDQVFGPIQHETWGDDDLQDPPSNNSDGDIGEDVSGCENGDGDDEDMGYSPTENLEDVIEALDEQLSETESPVAREILEGKRNAVQRSVNRVRDNPHNLSAEELWISDQLDGMEKIEELEEREAKLDTQYVQIEESMDRGALSQEVGEQNLLSVRYRQARLQTEALMAADGLTWNDIGELSDDVGHLVEDNSFPELRGARKAFRDIEWTKQRDVLEKTVSDGVISPEQAGWIWNQWR